jgi:hypothetical protein
MRRPSPALVIAVIALAGAWGGPAVAQSLIGSAEVKNNSLTSRDIKNRSLKGRDLKSNTITGRVVKGLSGADIVDDGLDGTDIEEGSLGQVPRAGSAAYADTAGTVNGARVARVNYARLVNAETTTLLDEGGLRIEARCTGAGTLDVHAVPTEAGSGLVRATATRPAGTSAVADNDFRLGDQITLTPGGSDQASGALTWSSPTGVAITVTYLAQDGLAAARGYQCAFAGTAVHATP